jgi:hypothetical protein
MKNRLAACIAATAFLVASTAFAADKDSATATIKTVFVGGHGESSMADKVNKMHAEMAAKGWKFADLDIYVENSDMQGIFVTYVREPAAAATAQ